MDYTRQYRIILIFFAFNPVESEVIIAMETRYKHIPQTISVDFFSLTLKEACKLHV